MQAILTRRERSIFEFLRAIVPDAPGAGRMEQTLQDLRPLQGTALIVGGVAVIRHKYVRTTEAIDLLYARADADIVARLLTHFNTEQEPRAGWHQLQHNATGVRLKLVPEGWAASHGIIPGPRQLDGTRGFVSYAGLIWLKLIAGRMRDFADLVELAKRGMTRAEAVCKKLNPELQPKYREVLAQARKEMENDPHNKWPTK